MHLIRYIQGLFDFLDLYIGFIHSLADNGLDQGYRDMIIDLIGINP